MGLPFGLAVGSALVSAYGQYKSGQAQAKSLRAQAQLDFLRAEEVLRRNDINNELLMESALVHTGTQKAQLAGSGRTLESGRDLIAETMSKAAEQAALNTEAAEWEARMVRMGASARETAAGDIKSSSTINAIGSLGIGLTNAYLAKKG